MGAARRPNSRHLSLNPAQIKNMNKRALSASALRNDLLNKVPVGSQSVLPSTRSPLLNQMGRRRGRNL
jgi:hypothetical protein